jgi:glycosyltransferase involved in cell wall biosynthesis
MTSISFVIPAYNEAKRIKNTIYEIVKVIKDLKLKKTEIIVIDDNSSDTTSSIIDSVKKNIQIS